MIRLRGIIVVALVFLMASVVALSEHAGAGVEYFPIPSVSTSKNDGNDVGLIVPILITDPDAELKYILAPMIIRNSIVGTRGFFWAMACHRGCTAPPSPWPSRSVSSVGRIIYSARWCRGSC